MLEARIAIESEAASLAASHRTPADLRAIRRALAIRADHRSEAERHVDTDTAFHRSIVAAAHNPDPPGVARQFHAPATRGDDRDAAHPQGVRGATTTRLRTQTARVRSPITTRPRRPDTAEHFCPPCATA
ncbi:FCD domain-containing protein [Gordonia sp. PP30]|uniref:FadR/GntR family transcriptional regulator n=1 Tax=unclassified Gordonia (in: high G+C Gram-positive bacteria) TaxID=2657482 RepID=UPI001FFF273F|nr:FCD domain-containing protein [Gordonia sp. PP30]UQE74119.1 FCD domain-containing protein [Gordonia sp. PP30]